MAVSPLPSLAFKKRAPRKLPDTEPPPDDIHAVFGFNLKVARLRRRMTLEDVARIAGMNLQYVSKVERGRVNLTFTSAKRLAGAVGQTMAKLIDPPNKR